MCVHSTRKFFKTQVMALSSGGLRRLDNGSYSRRHDTQSKGIEFLPGLYEKADLRVRPKSTISKHEMVIETIRHMLMSAEVARAEEALAEPDTKYLTPNSRRRVDKFLDERNLGRVVQEM